VVARVPIKFIVGRAGGGFHRRINRLTR